MVLPWKKRRTPIFLSSKRIFQNPYFQRETHDDFWVWTSIIGISFFFIIYGIFFSGYFDVEAVEISGNQHIQKETVENFSNDWRSQRVLWIFSRNNTIFFNRKKFKNSFQESLQDNFALKSLTVEKISFRKIRIVVNERIPGIIYVGFDGSNYFVDKEGVIGEKIQETKDKNDENKDFPRVLDRNKRTVSLGDKIFSDLLFSDIVYLTEFFPQKTSFEIENFSLPEVKCQEKQYILEKVQLGQEEGSAAYTYKKEVLEKYEKGELTLEEALESLNNNENTNRNIDSDNDPDNIDSPPGGNQNTNVNVNKSSSTAQKVQVKPVFSEKSCDYLKVLTQINIQTRKGPEIYFDTGVDLELQLNNLVSVLQNIADFKNLQYIDVRFDDRAYYK